ncbi:MAG TPA: GAF and ANTAR domain-containing protein [Acidimicrobiales bacterium]|jgi:GAF domain-containing protein
MEELPKDSIQKLARVTKLLRTQRTLPAKLETVVAIAKRTVANCDAGGISLLIDGEATTSAVTDRLAVEIDLVQYRTGQGPCLAAMEDSNVIRIDVLEDDSRFARFAPGALAFDINSVLSTPLVAADRTVGALNLYSRAVNAFDAESEAAAQPLAEYAAEVLSASPLYAYSLDMVDGLVESMENRAIINQAGGVIMGTEHCTAEEALDRLRSLALGSGESMRTVADWVIAERPTTPTPARERELPAREDPR